jgi:hypothetical protein
MHIIDRLVHLLIRVFEDGERANAQHLKAWQRDETDALHGSPFAIVLKRRLYDI